MRCEAGKFPAVYGTRRMQQADSPAWLVAYHAAHGSSVPAPSPPKVFTPKPVVITRPPPPPPVRPRGQAAATGSSNPRRGSMTAESGVSPLLMLTTGHRASSARSAGITVSSAVAHISVRTWCACACAIPAGRTTASYEISLRGRSNASLRRGIAVRSPSIQRPHQRGRSFYALTLCSASRLRVRGVAVSGHQTVGLNVAASMSLKPFIFL